MNTRTYTVYHEDRGLEIYAGPGLTLREARAADHDCEMIVGRSYVKPDRGPNPAAQALESSYLDELVALGGVTPDRAVMWRWCKLARKRARARLT
jgi:hypothetical protein